jgi:hypothetical protein
VGLQYRGQGDGQLLATVHEILAFALSMRTGIRFPGYPGNPKGCTVLMNAMYGFNPHNYVYFFQFACLVPYRRRFRNTQWFGLNKQIHISPAHTCGLFMKFISEKAGSIIVHNVLFQQILTDG